MTEEVSTEKTDITARLLTRLLQAKESDDLQTALELTATKELSKNSVSLAIRAEILAQVGQEAEAKQILGVLEENEKRNALHPLVVQYAAHAYQMMDDYASAVELWTRARAKHENSEDVSRGLVLAHLAARDPAAAQRAATHAARTLKAPRFLAWAAIAKLRHLSAGMSTGVVPIPGAEQLGRGALLPVLADPEVSKRLSEDRNKQLDLVSMFLERAEEAVTKEMHRRVRTELKQARSMIVQITQREEASKLFEDALRDVRRQYRLALAEMRALRVHVHRLGGHFDKARKLLLATAHDSGFLGQDKASVLDTMETAESQEVLKVLEEAFAKVSLEEKEDKTEGGEAEEDKPKKEEEEEEEGGETPKKEDKEEEDYEEEKEGDNVLPHAFYPERDILHTGIELAFAEGKWDEAWRACAWALTSYGGWMHAIRSMDSWDGFLVSLPALDFGALAGLVEAGVRAAAGPNAAIRDVEPSPGAREVRGPVKMETVATDVDLERVIGEASQMPIPYVGKVRKEGEEEEEDEAKKEEEKKEANDKVLAWMEETGPAMVDDFWTETPFPVRTAMTGDKWSPVSATRGLLRWLQNRELTFSGARRLDLGPFLAEILLESRLLSATNGRFGSGTRVNVVERTNSLLARMGVEDGDDGGDEARRMAADVTGIVDSVASDPCGPLVGMVATLCAATGSVAQLRVSLESVLRPLSLAAEIEAGGDGAAENPTVDLRSSAARVLIGDHLKASPVDSMFSPRLRFKAEADAGGVLLPMVALVSSPFTVSTEARNALDAVFKWAEDNCRPSQADVDMVREAAQTFLETRKRDIANFRSSKAAEKAVEDSDKKAIKDSEKPTTEKDKEDDSEKGKTVPISEPAPEKEAIIAKEDQEEPEADQEQVPLTPEVREALTKLQEALTKTASRGSRFTQGFRLRAALGMYSRENLTAAEQCKAAQEMAEAWTHMSGAVLASGLADARKPLAADDLICAAANLARDAAFRLLGEGKEREARQLLLEMAVLVRMGQSRSPSSSELALLAVRVFTWLSALEAAHAAFGSLRLRRMQWDSLGWLAVPHLARMGGYTEAHDCAAAVTMLPHLTRREADETAATALSGMRLSRAVDAWRFSDRSWRSVQRAEALGIQGMMLLPSKVSEAREYLRTNCDPALDDPSCFPPEPIDVMLDRSCLNHHLDVLADSAVDPPPFPHVERAGRERLRQRILWDTQRRRATLLALRCLALGRVGELDRHMEDLRVALTRLGWAVPCSEAVDRAKGEDGPVFADLEAAWVTPAADVEAIPDDWRMNRTAMAAYGATEEDPVVRSTLHGLIFHALGAAGLALRSSASASTSLLAAAVATADKDAGERLEAALNRVADAFRPLATRIMRDYGSDPTSPDSKLTVPRPAFQVEAAMLIGEVLAVVPLALGFAAEALPKTKAAKKKGKKKTHHSKPKDDGPRGRVLDAAGDIAHALQPLLSLLRAVGRPISRAAEDASITPEEKKEQEQVVKDVKATALAIFAPNPDGLSVPITHSTDFLPHRNSTLIAISASYADAMHRFRQTLDERIQTLEAVAK